MYVCMYVGENQSEKLDEKNRRFVITKESPSYLATSTRPIKMRTVLYVGEWNGSHDTLRVVLYGNVLLGWNFTCLQLLVHAHVHRQTVSLLVET